MKYKIVRVGIPIQEHLVTQEFLNILEEIKNNKNCVGITTSDIFSDYSQAPAGCKLLETIQQIKYTDKLIPFSINVMDNVWEIENEGKPRNIKQIVKFLIETFDNTENIETVYTFTPGSPNFHDAITEELKEIYDITIIDTLSSTEICIEEFKQLLNLQEIEIDIVAYADRFLFRNPVNKPKLNYKVLDNTKLNIFSCVQIGYEIDDRNIMFNWLNDLSKFFSEDSILIGINVGINKTTSIQTTLKNAKDHWYELCTYPKRLTFGIYQKGLP